MPPRTDITAPSPPEPQPREELALLFERHNEDLVGYLKTWIGNESDAREVAQEAYVRLLQLDRTDTISFLRAYLYRLAKNIAVDRQRHAEHVRRHATSPREQNRVNELEPAREHEGREALDIFRQALKELPSGYRRAFLQRRLSDTPPADIGQQLGLSSSQVHSYVKRTTAYCRLRVAGYTPAAARREVFR